MQITYDAEADRLMLSFDSDKLYKIWVTRRLIVLVWEQIMGATKQRFDENSWEIQEGKQGKLGHDRHYTYAARAFPKIQSNVENALFVTRLTMDLGDAHIITLEFADKEEEHYMRVQLTNAMFNIFVNILQQSLHIAQWNLGFPDIVADVASPTEATSKAQLH